MAPVMEGVFAINKPTMISSAQVVRDLQKHFKHSELFAPWLAKEKARISRENHNQQKRRKAVKRMENVKIGHGGTLDPLATGVLIAGIGSGTKDLQKFLLCTKTYEAVILFGTATDSYDRVGKVLRRAPYEHITQEMVEKAMEKFRGKFDQLPPLFSALKMNGKPLYEYAREGKELPREIERREVEVLELELVEWMDGGTHSHTPPTENAGPAEINLANKVWKQEGALPGGQMMKREDHDPAIKDDPEEDFESKKRKFSEGQDDLVSERPASKRKSKIIEPQEAIMSGGLAPPTPETASVAKEEPTKNSEVNEETLEEELELEEDSLPSRQRKGPPAAKIRMTVTSGFYVRSLCHDLGAAVGSAALMAELERTRQGDFEVGKNCLEYSDLEQGEEVWGPKVAQWLEEWDNKDKGPVLDEKAKEWAAKRGRTVDEALEEAPIADGLAVVSEAAVGSG